MTVILFDTAARHQLYPFSQTRPLADIRTGILTARERWSILLNAKVLAYTEAYLQVDEIPLVGEILFIDSTLDAGSQVISAIQQLKPFETLIQGRRVLASRDRNVVRLLSQAGLDLSSFQSIEFTGEALFLDHPWQIFQRNDKAIRYDFALLTAGRTSQLLPESNRVGDPSAIFIEEGAMVEHCILNASDGPIYLGRNSRLLEGSVIRGPFALCEEATVKMGSKIYGATTIGPYCIAGGEIKNTVMFAYSNKAHDGYLGDAVVGEWCNFGAGSSASNVKNSAGEVKVYDHASGSFTPVGIKCGVMMGDYSRCAINTSFNTGTIVGVCAGIFMEGLTPKYIRDFSWGGKGEAYYEFEKAVRDISNWKKLKNQLLSDSEVRQLKHIFDQNFQK